MSYRRWFSVFVTLTCLPPSPLRAQLLTDPSNLRHTFQQQVEWAEGLAQSRRDAALRFLAVGEAILALPGKSGADRSQLLGEAQALADRLASLDQELEEATTMARGTKEALVSTLDSRAATLRRSAADADAPRRQGLETQAHELEGEADALRTVGVEPEVEDPLESGTRTLSALAHVIAEEHDRFRSLQVQQEELRLFLGGLRLFDEMSMPPSARAGGSGEQDPGCGPSACAVGAASPADVPMMHSQPENPGGEMGTTATSATSLAQLHEQIKAYVDNPEATSRTLAQEDLFVTRETSVGAGLVAFRGDGDGSATMGPRVGTSLLFSWPLGESVGLSVEPSAGGRILRDQSTLFTEVVGEVREHLTGVVHDGRGYWLITSWQKGRLLSEPFPPPGYLEPGRLELGLLGRLSLPLNASWQLETEAGADGVRYEPEDWQGLDRHGVSGGLGLAWRGVSRSARLSLRGSHHGFPRSLAGWEERREDNRLGLEVDGGMEGRLTAKLSIGGAWNESRLPAYDFWLARTALVLSTPWGKGSLQGYAALVHQAYLNPGPEDARVAPSDQDSGSVLSLQYTHPLTPNRMLMVRGGWSRSQTGFRNDFYERFQLGVHMTFRGR